MKTLILIHGACHGGWCWRDFAKNLRSKGYNIYTPTLTGMGERKHLSSESLTLQVHIDDITNLIQYEDLTDVVLVGHSYAGLVIAAVNEVIPEKISQLVFLDSFIPQNGKSCLDVIRKEDAENWQAIAQAQGHGWNMPAGEASLDAWGVDDPAIREFLLPKITDFSINFLKTPIFLSENFDKVKKYYIRCTKPSYLSEVMLPFYQQAKAKGWQTYSIETSHDPMLTAPDELEKILIQEL